MGTEEILDKVKELAKEKSDYLPLIGAMAGVLLSGDKETKDKVLNGLVGAGVGYLVKGMVKVDEEDDEN